MEEESFELRVKRLFGSHLFDKVPASSFPASSWSVAAGEVEGEKWNRPSADGDGGEDDAAADRADTPCSSAFYGPDGCFSKKNRRENPRSDKDQLEADLDEIDEDDNDADREEEEEQQQQREGDEAIDVRSSIGLDPTLDREEEEDELDRAAFGVDQATDRVYMGQVMDHGPHISIHSVVPEIYDDFAPDFSRDPRADRLAAMKRLKEDNTTKLSKTKVTEKENNNNSTTDIKPILKRKESQDGTKPKKRVRFGTELKQEEEDSNAVPVPQPDIPDYLKNPSKYTKYTFDSADDSNDEETNKSAFNDFRNLVNRSTARSYSDAPFELPASVPFNPRKKLIPDSDSDTTMMHVDVGPTDTSKLCFADEASESCEMDEDSKEERESGGERKPAPARRYRSKEAHDE